MFATLSKALNASEDGDSACTQHAYTKHRIFFPEDGKVDVDKFPKCDLGGGTKVAKNWMCLPDACDIYKSIGTYDPIEARHLIQRIDD